MTAIFSPLPNPSNEKERSDFYPLDCLAMSRRNLLVGDLWRFPSTLAMLRENKKGHCKLPSYRSRRIHDYPSQDLKSNRVPPLGDKSLGLARAFEQVSLRY